MNTTSKTDTALKMNITPNSPTPPQSVEIAPQLSPQPAPAGPTPTEGNTADFDLLLDNAGPVTPLKTREDEYSLPHELIGGEYRVGASTMDLHLAPVELEVMREIVKGSGVDPALYRANIFVKTDENFILFNTGQTKLDKTRNGTPRKGSKPKGLDLSRGYWYSNSLNLATGRFYNNYRQFKPLAQSYSKKGDITKYFTQKGAKGAVYVPLVTVGQFESVKARYGVDYDRKAVLATQTAVFPDLALSMLYWQWVLSNPKIEVAITEGVKKTLCALTRGIPTIGLFGVANIHKGVEGSETLKKLTSELNLVREPGKKVVIMFDADIVDKAPVRKAMVKLITQLKKPLGSNTKGPDISLCIWNENHGKGIDDVFVNGQLSDEQKEEIFTARQSPDDWLRIGIERSWPEQFVEDTLEEKHGCYFRFIGGEFYAYNPETGCFEYTTAHGKKIADALKEVFDPSGDEESTTNANTPRNIKNIEDYLKFNRVIDESKTNPVAYRCYTNIIIHREYLKDQEEKYYLKETPLKHDPLNSLIFTESLGYAHSVVTRTDAIDVLLESIAPENRETWLDAISCIQDPDTSLDVLRRNRTALVLSGTGVNGKDTWGNVLKFIAGQANTTSVALAALKAHSYDKTVFLLENFTEDTRLNWDSETNSASFQGNSTLKSMTTGDSTYINRKGKKGRNIRVKALQIFCTNDKLFLPDDDSLTSRVNQFDFPYTFVREETLDDPKEKIKRRNKIVKVMNPIINDHWLLHVATPQLDAFLANRLVDVLNRGYIDWSCCAEAKEKMVEESNHTNAFQSSDFIELVTTENGAPDEDAIISPALLHQIYIKFLVDSDLAEEGYSRSTGKPEPKPIEPDKFDPICRSAGALSKRLKKDWGATQKRVSIGGKQIRCFVGFKPGPAFIELIKAEAKSESIQPEISQVSMDTAESILLAAS